MKIVVIQLFGYRLSRKEDPLFLGLVLVKQLSIPSTNWSVHNTMPTAAEHEPLLSTRSSDDFMSENGPLKPGIVPQTAVVQILR